MPDTLLPLTLADLRFGDILLKDAGNRFDLLIKLKRGSRVSHSELFVGTQCGHAVPQVITALDTGVNYYPASLDDLCYVLRPDWQHLPTPAGLSWFERVARGQGYDWAGLLAFSFAQLQGEDNGKQFCSEVIARIFKKSGAALLHARKDADTYAPDSYLDSPFCTIRWARPGFPFDPGVELE